MTSKQLENKIKDLDFWLDNNPNHPDRQQNLNKILHYEFKLNELKKLNA